MAEGGSGPQEEALMSHLDPYVGASISNSSGEENIAEGRSNSSLLAAGVKSIPNIRVTDPRTIAWTCT